MVLSACETGLRSLRVDGEGTMSLARSFLAAGAGEVVFSLFPRSMTARLQISWPAFIAGSSLARPRANHSARPNSRLLLQARESGRGSRRWAELGAARCCEAVLSDEADRRPGAATAGPLPSGDAARLRVSSPADITAVGATASYDLARQRPAPVRLK